LVTAKITITSIDYSSY